MAAGRLNLVWVQGTPFRRAFAAKVGGESGPPRDLTGWSARMQVRVFVHDPEPIADLSSDTSSILTLDEEAGTLFLDVPAEFSSRLPSRRGVYGINLIDPQGDPVPFLEGRWTVRSRPIR